VYFAACLILLTLFLNYAIFIRNICGQSGKRAFRQNMKKMPEMEKCPGDK